MFLLFVTLRVSSGVTNSSQLRSFSFSESDNIKRFFGEDELLPSSFVAKGPSLFSLPSEEFWVSADVFELPLGRWNIQTLVSARKLTQQTELSHPLSTKCVQSFSKPTVCLSVMSASVTLSGPSLCWEHSLWKCLMKMRGKAVRRQELDSEIQEN